MALTVTVKNDAFPEDQEFNIIGLGVFKNGEAREITEEDEKSFIGFAGKTLEDALHGNASMEASGSAIITDTSDVLPDTISDRPSKDPTAMNLVDGEIFVNANLGGKVSDPDEIAMAEEEVVVTEPEKAEPDKVELPNNLGGGE